MAKLTIKKHDGKFHISSTDDDIKQVFFGWADDRENPEFYGIGFKIVGARCTCLHGSAGCPVHDAASSRRPWHWELSTAKMKTLAMYIGLGFAKNYYTSRKDKADHRYVLERLEKAVAHDDG